MNVKERTGQEKGGLDPIVQHVAAQLGAEEPRGYSEWIADLKLRVRTTQATAARIVSAEVLKLYWSTGRDILNRQHEDGWGTKVIERISKDMKQEFPGQRGWSRTNLYSMRKAAEAWPTEDEFVHHTGGQLPWRHVVVLLDRLDTREDRDWYAARAAAEGWKREVLEVVSSDRCNVILCLEVLVVHSSCPEGSVNVG